MVSQLSAPQLIALMSDASVNVNNEAARVFGCFSVSVCALPRENVWGLCSDSHYCLSLHMFQTAVTDWPFPASFLTSGAPQTKICVLNSMIEAATYARQRPNALLWIWQADASNAIEGFYTRIPFCPNCQLFLTSCSCLEHTFCYCCLKAAFWTATGSSA
jgi:hypothetical protein